MAIPAFARRRKLALIVAAIVLPVLVLAGVLVWQSSRASAVLTREMAGTVYLRAVWDALADEDSTAERLDDLQSAAAQFDRKLGLEGDHRALAAALTAEPQRAGEALRGFMTRVSDASGLTLDPAIDTYYLMNTAVNNLPQVSQALPANRPPDLTMLRQGGAAVDRSLETAMHGSRDDGLKTALAPALRGFDARMAAMQAAPDAPGAGRNLRAAVDTLWLVTVNQLDRLLVKRLAAERMRLWTILAVAALVSLGTLAAVIFIDIYIQREETLRLNAGLRRSNEELERFAYICSHDMQEPVRMISLYAGMLDEDAGPELDEIGRRHLTYIRDSAGRLQTMIRDILAFSRLGREEIQIERVDSARVFDEVLADHAATIAAKSAVVTAGELPVVMASPVMMRILLHNLVGNALKFQSGIRRPEVSVTAERAGDMWRFTVSDNGIGIDEAYRDQMFVMFRRLNRKEQYAGTGIGLATCHKIMELCDGTVDFAANPGGGSRFFFAFPAREA